MSFSQRQKILKCLWSKKFELQKCGHTEKSNDGLNLSIILMFLTIYGVGNRSVTAAMVAALQQQQKIISLTGNSVQPIVAFQAATHSKLLKPFQKRGIN